MKLIHRNRPVIAQSFKLSLFKFKKGVIDLIAAGVHNGADNSLCRFKVICKTLEGGDPDAGLIFGKGHTLNGRNANSHPRKGTGSLRHGKDIDVRKAHFGTFEGAFYHGGKGFRMLKPHICVKFGNYLLPVKKSAGGGDGRRVHGKNIHSVSAPSTTNLRTLSAFPREISIFIKSSGNASTIFSLHSRAKIPHPR